MLRLHPDVAVPIEPEPGEVVDNRRRELRAAAPGIDVLQPQQEFPARFPRPPPGEQRRMGVAQMQAAGRTGREPGGYRHAARYIVFAPVGNTSGDHRWRTFDARSGWTTLGTPA